MTLPVKWIKTVSSKIFSKGNGETKDVYRLLGMLLVFIFCSFLSARDAGAMCLCCNTDPTGVQQDSIDFGAGGPGLHNDNSTDGGNDWDGERCMTNDLCAIAITCDCICADVEHEWTYGNFTNSESDCECVYGKSICHPENGCSEEQCAGLAAAYQNFVASGGVDQDCQCTTYCNGQR